MALVSRPFLDFYGEKGIIPTAQRITSHNSYSRQRAYLYRQLGIPLHWLKGKSVFELGPGNGQKAEFLLQYRPDLYLAVDGNPVSVAETSRRLKPHQGEISIEVQETDFLTFSSELRFDLVIAEAVIPTQLNPAEFLTRLCDLAKPGGIVLFTCMDQASLLAEMLRRAIATELLDPSKSLSRQAAALAEFFSADLAALKGMTRLPQDWVIDQLIHPWLGPLFNIPSALAAVQERVEFLGSSPNFVQDWRWYKSPDVLAPSASHAISSFWKSAHNLLDQRVTLPDRHPDLNRELFQGAQALYTCIINQRYESLDHLAEMTLDFTQHVPTEARLTLDSIAAFSDFARSRDSASLQAMRSWWGRGQQYVSVTVLAD